VPGAAASARVGCESVVEVPLAVAPAVCDVSVDAVLPEGDGSPDDAVLPEVDGSPDAVDEVRVSDGAVPADDDVLSPPVLPDDIDLSSAAEAAPEAA